MRIGNTLTLALVLFGSVPVWSQPTTDVPVVPKTAPAIDYSTEPVLQQSALNDSGAYVEGGGRPATASPQLFWLRADYLMWYINQEAIAPVILRVPDQFATSASIPAGAGTALLPDKGELKYNALSGVRLNAGMWFGPENKLGFDISSFMLENGGQSLSVASNGSPIISRFFDNTTDGRQTFLFFSSPDPAFAYGGNLTGSFGISNLYSGDASIRWNGYRVFSDNTDWLFGARTLGFNERLDVVGNLFLPDGRTLNIQDHFKVQNQFYGGQIGFHSRWVGFYRLSLDTIVKFAVGGTSQKVNINGSNTFINPDGTRDSQPVGLLATANNSGHFSKGKFTVIPDMTFNLNFNVTERSAIYVGYSAIYVSNVSRLNTVVQSQVNDATVRYLSGTTPNGLPNPGFAFNDTGMWIQGLNLGARFEY